MASSATEQQSDNGPVRVAVLGYGLAGSVFHAPLIAATPGLRVAAIVTGSPERQARARHDYPDATIYATADDLWRDAAQVDVAVVATPNRSHVALGLAALEAGLHLVVDKPVAPGVSGAERLLAASQRTGKHFTVFQNRRWDNDFLTLRQVLAEGALGAITRFESRYERYRPTPKADVWRERGDPEDAGGLLFDLGAHVIDQALTLFGRPTQVYAEIERRRAGVAVDDDTFVALRFPDGVLAHLWVSAVAPLGGPRFRALGLRGGYEKYGLDPQEEQLQAGLRPGDAGWGVEPRDQWGRLKTTLPGGLTLDGQVETLPGAYEQFYAQLRDAITSGGALPVDPADAIAALRVIEAARQLSLIHI